MDILTVFSKSDNVHDDHAIVRVYWKTGLHRIQALDVRLTLSCPDRLAAAEAVAIRYLLGEKHVFNVNRTGINLRIVVSKGAIKKMARQVSQKADLYEYGYPILTRYGEADIQVSKDKSWFPIDDDLLEIPVIQGESLRGIEQMESETMGLIAVTRHALERYGEHCHTNNMNTSWKNLHRRLRDNLNKIQLPSSVILHKLRKYGEEPEVWTSPSNPLHYVFCLKNNCRVLVTVFNKDPDELSVFRPSLANK
jgi:hypothetical protein